jgi:hypothetical protein
MKGLELMRDPQALTEMSEDIDTRPSEEQKAAARRIIAANAVGATHAEQLADAEELMRMLGVHPSQDGDLDYPVYPVNMPGPILT